MPRIASQNYVTWNDKAGATGSSFGMRIIDHRMRRDLLPPQMPDSDKVSKAERLRTHFKGEFVDFSNAVNVMRNEIVSVVKKDSADLPPEYTRQGRPRFTIPSNTFNLIV